MRNFKYNSETRPADYAHDYDVHIYFTESDLKFVQNLKEKIGAAFSEASKSKEVFIGDLIPKAIGPHPRPMLEINFAASRFAQIVPWLMRERRDLSILVHQITGDDYYDHTQGALWLGSPVALDLSRFVKT